MKKILFTILLPLMGCAVSPPDQTPVPEPEAMVETLPVETTSNPAALSIVQENGSSVALTDGNLYQIHPDDWAKSSGWIGNAAGISVQDTKDGSPYPLILTNAATGTSVRATLASPEGSGSGS